MTTPENSGEANNWVQRDPAEEAERVERHLEMLQDMLADDHSDIAGSPQVTSVRISFGRIFEDGDMQAFGDEEHLGTLLGVILEPEPTAVIANYEAWQHGPEGPDGEPQWSSKIQSSDVAQVPIRLMNGIFGATGTYEDFEALEERNDPS